MSKLAGFEDSRLHQAIQEALKVLAGAKDAYMKALSSIEGQYLQSLETSHDGDSAECVEVKGQIAAVRDTFLQVQAPVAEPRRVAGAVPVLDDVADTPVPAGPAPSAAKGRNKKK